MAICGEFLFELTDADFGGIVPGQDAHRGQRDGTRSKGRPNDGNVALSRQNDPVRVRRTHAIPDR